MSADSNTGFHPDLTLDDALNCNAISFQLGAINSTSEMIPMGNYYGHVVNSAVGGMMFPGNSSFMNSNMGITTPQAGNSSASLLEDDTDLAVEWSVAEQYKLEEGLVKFTDEPSIMKYVKIAATLPDKTVRDVALRCRWMMRKRRKHEDHNLGKRVKDRKDNLAESSLKTNMSSASPLSAAACSLTMNYPDRNDHISWGALSGTTRHLLEQNNQVLGQISANLSARKLWDNIDLFFHTRNNLMAIVNEMRNMPVMSRMPPLPVINEELANIFPNTTQGPSLGPGHWNQSCRLFIL